MPRLSCGQVGDLHSLLSLIYIFDVRSQQISKVNHLIYLSIINNLQLMNLILKKYSRVVSIYQPHFRYYFAGLLPSFLRPSDSRNTEIVSLSIEQTEQLMSINAYSQSTEHLSKNNLSQSLLYLTYALQQAKNTYPYSVNLQNCLLNRISILQKLLSRNKDLIDNLQQIYLITISSKGPKHLSTIKSLVNYLIALTIYNPAKLDKVLEFLSDEQGIPDYVIFFEAVNDIRTRKAYRQGLKKMEALPEESSDQKIFKYNNIAFLTIHSLRQEHKNPLQYLTELKKRSSPILQHLLRALIIAENNPQFSSGYSEQQILQSQKLISILQSYISKQKTQLPTGSLPSKQVLKHSNSHIIAMNIASLLFELQKVKQSFYFLQLSLDKAVSSGQLQRVGMALVLLGRCYYQQDSDKWQDIYLDVLKHAKTYPPLIIKEALSSYSRILFQKGRLYEAQNYLNQSLSIQCQSGLEGLILPSYDFSF